MLESATTTFARVPFSVPAAFIASGEMAVAYFWVHAPGRGLFPWENGGEKVALYSIFFLLLAALGAGAYGLDGVTRRARPARRRLTRLGGGDLVAAPRCLGDVSCLYCWAGATIESNEPHEPCVGVTMRLFLLSFGSFLRSVGCGSLSGDRVR